MNRSVKIECKDWASLRALYLPETPETVLGLTTISNFIQWNERESPLKNLSIYSLNGDWLDGTFVVVVCEVDLIVVIVRFNFLSLNIS